MQLVVVNVVLPDKLETPRQNLEPGEFIVCRVVQLSKLSDELKGIGQCPMII
jgi:ADP-ribose pyrophosphatase